jgi:hypothetical protein
MIRSKNPIPTAKEFKYNLRAICIAQYLKKHNVENGCEVLIVPKKKSVLKVYLIVVLQPKKPSPIQRKEQKRLNQWCRHIEKLIPPWGNVYYVESFWNTKTHQKPLCLL